MHRSGGTARWSFGDRVIAITHCDGPRGRAQRKAFEKAGATVVEVALLDEGGIESLATEIGDRFGRLDALVVNGSPVSPEPVTEMEEETWDRVIDENVTFPFLLFKHLVPRMTADALGKVVVTTGPETARGYAGLGHLCAARHAVFGLSKDLACEVAGRQINVNATCPSNGVDDEAAANHDYAVRELTDSVLWLCADASRFVTGSAVQLNRVAV